MFMIFVTKQIIKLIVYIRSLTYIQDMNLIDERSHVNVIHGNTSVG